MEFIKKLWNDEKGQGMVEYGLIIALVSIIAIVGLAALGGRLNTIFDAISKKLPTTVQ